MRSLPLILAIVFSGLFSSSCFERGEGLSSGKFFHAPLFSVYKVSEINGNFVGAEKIMAAPGTWSSALRLHTRVNDFQRLDYCLLVKAPYRLEPGELKFVIAESFAKECSEYLFSKPASRTVKFYNLSIAPGADELRIKADDREFQYRFINQSGWSLQISTPAEEGKRERRFLKEGEFCFKVANDCSVSADQCDLCEGGSYYVKNNSCLSAYSKVCGQDKCGLKGEPACIRGQVSTGVKDYCIQDSPVGFCSGNARVACVNGLLICE